MDNLVTIKTSMIPGELAVAKSYLEDNEIFCFLKDELTFQVQPYAIGGVKLQVREADAEVAIRLLIEGGFAKEADYQEDSLPKWVVDLYKKITSYFGGK